MTRSEELISRARALAHAERNRLGEGSELQEIALELAEELEITVRLGMAAVQTIHELVKDAELA